MTSLQNKPIFNGDAFDDNTGPQFDDLAQSRGRTSRASSLALDKDQTFLSPSNLMQNNRRHSSHYCPVLNDTNNILLPSKNVFNNTSSPGTNSTLVTQNHTNSTNLCTSTPNRTTPQAVNQSTTTPTLVPPPVPKRNFYGNKQHDSKPNEIIQNNGSFGKPLKLQPAPKGQNSSSTQYNNNDNNIYSNRMIINNNNNNNNNSKHQFVDNSDNEDNFSLSPLSLNEKDKFDEIIIYERTNSKLAQSNQHSSSESNRSQNTNDTGYMSSTEIDRQPIFTIGHNNDSQNQKSQFRSRFSSEETQSSLDSYASPDYSNNSEILESPQNKYLNDSVFTLSSNNINKPGKMSSTKSINDNEMIQNRRPPAVPIRKQVCVPPKIPPPVIKQQSQNSIRSRTTPPPPPLRSQTSLDSGKLFQNNHILGAFQQQQNNQSQKDNLQELQSRPVQIKKGIHRTNKPPPLTQIHHSKLNQRQDSNISSDSYSFASSSPGYNSKSMEAPLLQYASKINKTGLRHQDSNDSFGMIIRYNNLNNGNLENRTKLNSRQDSNISSDSFSQTSSPGYNTKLMEAPLITNTVKLNSLRQPNPCFDEIIKDSATENCPSTPITKSMSTPASLQTIVRIQNGSNMSLQHKILKSRKSSNSYVTRGRLKFRVVQVLFNAIALLAIAAGLAAYFKAYPTVKFVNKTIITTAKIMNTTILDDADGIGRNPVPGVCLPVIVKFCQNHQIPYNFTVFPNYIGHFGQPEAQMELDAYDALVDVRCYELVSLFLCSLFVPKCSSTGMTVPPCRSLCFETMRRCGFFFDVFGLELPGYITCSIFTESPNLDECVGLKEVKEARVRAQKPNCSGFLCDQKRCLPNEWRCDGHVDCLDQTDESQCNECEKGSIYCGDNKCMSQKHVCDGVVDCPWGQDERNCVRLSERNGDLGRGTLEVYKADSKQWAPACVMHWDQSTSPTTVCSMLGYNSVNSSKITMRGTNVTIAPPTKDTPAMWRMYQKRNTNLMKEFTSCPINGHYPVVELTCSNFECGKIRNRKYKASKRIVGGSISSPGDWPFLAAILGGPEEIFYCAGVLIADQWILTASHCIGNHTLRNINDWTIQLGITRRHSHTYYGQKVKVKSVIPHPQYNSNVAHDNDIALFQLATRVAFHEHLLPVCLPPALKELKPGTLCTVIGWGKREDKSASINAASATYEAAVNEVQVPVLNRDLCNEWLDQLNVTEGMICAGYQEGGKDACQGDSGGPLLCRDPYDRERWFVGGIVSWGIMCAHPRLPGVYANVPKYIPWIMQQIHKYSNNHSDNFFN